MMKLKLATVNLLLLALLNTACQNIEQSRREQDLETNEMLTEKHSETVLTDIPFAIAQNYYARNDAPTLDDPKITTQRDFERFFGDATLMGKEGQPTPIDFEQQFVIAIVMKPSDFDTKIEPMNLRSTDDEKLQFRYTVTVHERQQYTSHPALILVVDKKHEATVVLKRED